MAEFTGNMNVKLLHITTYSSGHTLFLIQISMRQNQRFWVICNERYQLNVSPDSSSSIILKKLLTYAALRIFLFLSRERPQRHAKSKSYLILSLGVCTIQGAVFSAYTNCRCIIQTKFILYESQSSAVLVYYSSIQSTNNNRTMNSITTFECVVFGVKFLI